tara:strand:+ start:539 stop:742 length:204 start_codon:yes stop_codon:yes gene_type:complete
MNKNQFLLLNPKTKFVKEDVYIDKNEVKKMVCFFMHNISIIMRIMIRRRRIRIIIIIINIVYICIYV